MVDNNEHDGLRIQICPNPSYRNALSFEVLVKLCIFRETIQKKEYTKLLIPVHNHLDKFTFKILPMHGTAEKAQSTNSSKYHKALDYLPFIDLA